jgi:hypothetical protein
MTIRLLMILEGLHYKVNRKVINYYFQIIRLNMIENRTGVLSSVLTFIIYYNFSKSPKDPKNS